MSDGSYGYGLIGCGWVASAHAWGVEALRDEGVSLIAVADLDDGAAQGLASRFRVPHVLSDYRQLLARDDIEAVSVCLPDFLHREVVLAAAEAGKHVLCEKPLAMNVAEADEMVDACAVARVGLGLIMNHRYAPDNIRAKAAIAGGAVGRPLMGSVLHSSGLTGNPDGSSPWRGKQGRAAGGVLSTQAIHFLDLLLWLLGPVRSVKAWAGRLLREEQDHEDTIALALRFDSGALATLTATNGSPIMDDFTGTRIEVHGSEGWLLLDGDRLTRFEPRPDHESPEFSLPPVPPGASEIIFGVGHVHEVMDFVRAVRSGREVPVPGTDGRHLMAVIEAAYRSAAEDQEVELPESPTAYPTHVPEGSLLDASHGKDVIRAQQTGGR